MNLGRCVSKFAGLSKSALSGNRPTVITTVVDSILPQFQCYSYVQNFGVPAAVVVAC